MARAQEDLEATPTYLEFFGMTRAPFARVAQPEAIFHAEQYSLLYEHLARASTRPDCLIVVCGADGSGKTSLLNRYIASLGEEAFFACFDENCSDATQFHCGFLRQLGFNDITGSLNELRHISREFLVHRGLAGDHILLLVDNAHLISPSVLEQLRWLSDVKANDQRAVSIVLSGNADLPRIMDSPAMRSLQFRDHVDFNIRVYTRQETDEYVRHRMRLAGGAESAKWSSDSRALIHRFSGGIPGLINRLCNAVLSEACAQETRVITEELIRNVAEEHKFVPHVIPLHCRGRRRSDRPEESAALDSTTEERISPREVALRPAEEMLRSAPDTAAGEVAELRAQIAALSAQLVELKAEKEKAALDVAARDGDINALLDKIASQSKALETRAAAERKNTNEIERLNRALSESGAALRESKEDLGKLTAELKTEKSAAKKNSKELTKSAHSIEKLERLKLELRSQIKDRASELRELRAELKKNTAETVSSLKSRDKTIADLEKSLKRSRAECDSLRSDVSTLEDLQKSLDKVQKESDSLRSDAAAVTELKETLQQVQKECDSLRTDAATKQELERSLDEASKECDALRADASAKKELEESLDEIRKECDALRVDASVKKELEITVDEIRKECDALRADASAKQELEESLDEIQKECDALRGDASAKKELEESLDKIRKECDALRADASAKKEFEESLGEVRMECEELRAEVAAKRELEESLDEIRRECDALRADASAKQELEESLDEIRKECDALRTDAATAKELQDALISVEKECDSLRSDASAVEGLRASLDEKESHIAALQRDLESYAQEVTATKVMLLNERTGSQSSSCSDDTGSLQQIGSLATIEVLKNGKTEQMFEIEPGQSRIMIGRSDDSELCLDSKFVSRHHALIFLNRERAHIEDLRSYNGTVVNGRKTARSDLHPDDEILIGDFKLRIVSI